MKKITLKKIGFWLFGETAGRTFVACWKYLWGVPVEAGGKVAVRVAKESIKSMEESIAQLVNAVAQVDATYKLAKQQYDQKLGEFYEAEKQAELTYNKGHEQAARLALTRAISIENILPQIKERVEKVEITRNKANEKLNREREKLAAHKLELANIETLALVNRAMAEINNIETGLDIDSSSAKAQYEEAQLAIHKRSLYIDATLELSEDPSAALGREIDALSLDEKIANRFQSFSQKKS